MTLNIQLFLQVVLHSLVVTGCWHVRCNERRRGTSCSWCFTPQTGALSSKYITSSAQHGLILFDTFNMYQYDVCTTMQIRCLISNYHLY